ncbi:dna mismatch repair protein mutl [hydrocarbon metagenome]|uniref:Dna mismatch repair protein mutl n=1 Tax=hydrocarbon metagenome TaxID=938273 RepID=A0A0W8E882_9ZZZZ
MTIRLLDDDLINKIAAGEVIERPASIVKELIENSIDSGARKITVKISGGGCEKIEVEDDGQGLSFNDIPLAFLRHATSKINREEDLQFIQTMGFRGEALPSIASVSRIDIYSKYLDEPGVYACLEGGQMLIHHVNSSPAGTRIVVKDLFYNTPARRKFLKTVVTESNHIFELMCKYALARPDISFSYSSEKKAYFKTPGSGSLLDAVIAVYGRDFAEHLMEVYYTGDAYQIEGLISKPEIKRTNRKNQLIFINRRPIRSPILYRSIDQAYQGRLLSREYPVVILSIVLDPAAVDVNVHPQKSEVRFRDEQGIFRAVLDVLRVRLEKSNWSVNINYFNQDKVDAGGKTFSGPGIYPKFTKQQPIFGDSIIPVSSLEQMNYGDHIDPASLADDHISEQQACNSGQDFKIIGQVFNSYILIQKDNSLWIADQHAAHEKVLFASLLNDNQQDQDHVQDLIFPITLELSSKQMDILEQNMGAMNSLGFIIQVIGCNSIAIRTVPLAAAGREKEVLDEIFDELLQNKFLPDLNRKILAIISCQKAVKAGSRLRIDEMERIIKDLFALEDYQHCPHGRPTIIRLSYEDLERMFKRR